MTRRCRRDAPTRKRGRRGERPRRSSTAPARKPSSNKGLGEFLQGVGTLILVGGVITLMLGHTMDWGILATFGSFAALSIGGGMLRYGKQLAMPTAEERLRSDRRPPVLFLRAFRRDQMYIPVPRKSSGNIYHPDYHRNRAGYTYEEELEHIFGPLGPFIALGAPGDQIRPLGAARAYVRDEDWKDQIRAFVERAQVVLVALDHTDNLLWELREVLQEQIRPYVILLMPDFEADPHNPHERSQAWRQNTSTARRAFPFLPAISTKTAGLAFSPSGDPIRIQARSHSIQDHCKALESFAHAMAKNDPGGRT
jgi:hypothetical protein